MRFFPNNNIADSMFFSSHKRKKRKSPANITPIQANNWKRIYFEISSDLRGILDTENKSFLKMVSPLVINENTVYIIQTTRPHHSLRNTNHEQNITASSIGHCRSIPFRWGCASFPRRKLSGYRETLRRLSFREEACGGMLTLHPLRRSGGRGRLRRHAHRHRLLQRLLHGERRDGEVGVESVGVVLTVRDEQRERGVAEIRRLESGEVRVVPPRLGVILWACLSLERGNGRLREMKWKI